MRQFQRQIRNEEQLSTSMAMPVKTSVSYPTSGWSTDLKRMPLFSRAELDEHISQCGKNIDPKSKYHSVPTGLKKAKTYLEDEYFKNIVCTSDEKHFYFKSSCYHSYRKKDSPHSLKIALCIVTASVKHAYCSCVAGQGGFCNHVLGLMLKICRYGVYKCKDICELDNEDDMTASVACTSTLQMWHKTERGENIKAQPVMEIAVKKTKLDSNSKDGKFNIGSTCLLYEARKNIKSHEEGKQNLIKTFNKINPLIPLSYILTPGKIEDSINTKFGKAERGSYCSYQLQFTEANFSVLCNLSSVSRNNRKTKLHSYPHFPLKPVSVFTKPDNLNLDQHAIFEHIIVDEQRLNDIEKHSREQSCSEKWKKERKYRLTASNFKTIVKRQRNHTTLTKNLLNPKSVTSKYTEHGIKHEPIALQQYEKYMFSTRKPVQVLKSGLVISMAQPFIAASPDGRVIDSGCDHPFGLVEVKCPLTKFMVTPAEACVDDKFFAKLVDGKPSLKREHMYYYQVQGQLACTGAHWCDFIILTSMGLSIERIVYDHNFWKPVEEKLKCYFFEHFLNTAAVEFAKEYGIYPLTPRSD